MSRLEMENEMEELEMQDSQLNESDEQDDREDGKETMGYSSGYVQESGEHRNPGHWQRARDYYYRSRNGHREAVSGVTFENVLKRDHPERPQEHENQNHVSDAYRAKEEKVETAEVPIGDVLKKELEKQGLGTEVSEKKDGMRILQTSTHSPRYNVSFRGSEASEQEEGKEAMGASSDHWGNRMEEALENNDRTTFLVAKNNYLEALAEEAKK